MSKIVDRGTIRLVPNEEQILRLQKERYTAISRCVQGIYELFYKGAPYPSGWKSLLESYLIELPELYSELCCEQEFEEDPFDKGYEMLIEQINTVLHRLREPKYHTQYQQ